MGINALIYSIGLCGKKLPTCYINVNKVNFEDIITNKHINNVKIDNLVHLAHNVKIGSGVISAPPHAAAELGCDSRSDKAIPGLLNVPLEHLWADLGDFELVASIVAPDRIIWGVFIRLRPCWRGVLR